MKFECETRWSPNDLWNSLQELATKLDLRVEMEAEEPGMEIYVNTDTDGDIFPERFLIDANVPEIFCKKDSYEDKEYFASLKELTDFAEELFLGNWDEKTIIKDLESFDKYLRDNLDDCYLNVYEFENI